MQVVSSWCWWEVVSGCGEVLLATDVALASNAKVSSCSSASNGAHSDWSAALLALLPG